MNRKIAGLVMILMFFFSNSVFAANWVYVATSNITGVNAATYVDSESVIITGETINFWTLTKKETPDFANVKYELRKHEAKQPRTLRDTASYLYDINKKLIASVPKINGSFKTFQAGTMGALTVEAAFKYAKEGNDTGEQPSFP